MNADARNMFGIMLVAALAFLLESGPGCHTYNYADKPDFTMNALVRAIKRFEGRLSRAEAALDREDFAANLAQILSA